MKKLFTDLYADENILHINEDSGNTVFNYNEMGIDDIVLNNINLDDNFDKEDPNTIILIRRLAWHIKFEKRKKHKKELVEKLTGCVTSYKMVTLVCFRRWKNGNKFNVY